MSEKKMVTMRSVSGKEIEVPASEVERRKFYGYQVVKPAKKKKAEVENG